MSGLFGSVEGFYEMFGVYNRAVWPMPVVMYVLAVAAVVLAVKKTKRSDSFVSLIMGFFWLWGGIVFSLMYFGRFHPIGYFSALLFMFQGKVFVLNGLGVGVKPRVSFRFCSDGYGWVGALLVLYALVVYPLIGFATGHGYPGGPIFGTAPCPVTIFTIGMLCWTERKEPTVLFIVPILWGVCGILAVAAYGVFADIGLVVSGLVGIVLLVRRKNS